MTVSEEMPRANLIATVREAIGVGEPETDWKVTPTVHADSLPPEASPLADLLRASRPEGLARQYEDLNQRAVKARDEFKKTIARANWAVFFTASFAALLLVASSLQTQLGETPAKWAIGIIGCLGVISGFLAIMWISEVRQGSLAEKWSRERASAEAKRLAYFKCIMEESATQPLDQLLAFEYTRRYLLENQIDYFRDRSRQHEEKANAARKVSTRAVFLSSSLTSVAGLLAMWHPQLAIIAGLGVIATAYSALAVSQSNLNQDQRNADRYRLAQEQLEERALAIDDFRERVAQGEAGAVKAFYSPIFVVLAADHKRFLDEAEKRSIEIDAMSDRVKSTAATLARNQPAPPAP